MAEITRRAALAGVGVAIGTVAAGCGSSEEEASAGVPPEGEGTSPPATNQSPAPGPTNPAPSDPPKPGPALGPKELLAGIEHIVVLMMENRSFDHFLGALKTDKGYAASATVDGLTGTESNPAPNGGAAVSVYKMSNFTPADPPHGWDAVHKQYNGGKNDQFVIEHKGESQNEVMGYHDRSQIPLFYWFADNFATCDAWFCSVMGPTWPNRFYLHATTSKGKKDNSPFLVGGPETIWEALAAKGLTAKNYYAGAVTWYLGGFAGKVFQGKNPSVKMDEFFDDAANGTLPSFSLIDPDFQASDDHPDHNIQRGQAFVASVYKALAASPLWTKTLLIVTYDEHGGFYDHVPPPTTVDDEAEFVNLGFRVPTFVIGAMVKKGYVCKKTLEHVSVASTLKTRCDIKSLSKRMDATADITDCIDPVKVKAPVMPPAGMPVVAMTMETALYDGVGTWSQPKLEQMIVEGTAQRADSRNEQERIAAWLENATKLGAVRIL
jgi:phospholipase C